MVRLRMVAVVGVFCAASAAWAQSGPGCHATLGYLSDTIPATGDAKLDGLRQRILATKMADVVAKASDQRLSVEDAINLNNQEADGTDANVPKLSAVLEAEAGAGTGDGVVHALAVRDYSSADLTGSKLGAATRAYIANDFHEVAYRATANQLFCFTLARPGDPDGPLLSRSGAGSGPQVIEGSEAAEEVEVPAVRAAAVVAETDSDPEDLESTLGFLQSRLNALGPVSWAETTEARGSRAGVATERNTVEFQSVEAEPERCALSFHERHLTTPGVEKASEVDEVVRFAQPKEISVFTLSERAREDYQASRVREFRGLTPEITVVHVADGSRHGVSFYFADAEEARLVGGAARHAADLCSQGAEALVRE